MREKGSTWLNSYAVVKRVPEVMMWFRLNLGIWFSLNYKGRQRAPKRVEVAG